jgi:hypothetical protein
VGIVDKLMPDQGKCNVRMILINSHNLITSGSAFATTPCAASENGKIEIATGFDYADVAELGHLEDCFKLFEAVHDYGSWNSPYLMAGGTLDTPLPRHVPD